MRLVGSFLFEGIGKALHARYGDVAKEPLPERWLDLVNLLDKKEGIQRRASELQRSWRGFGVDVQSKAVFDAQYWRDRAEEARLHAAEMTHPPARREMLLVAAGYRRMAQHAEERTAHKKPRA